MSLHSVVRLIKSCTNKNNRDNNFIFYSIIFSTKPNTNKYKKWDLSQTNKIMYSHSPSIENGTKNNENNFKQESFTIYSNTTINKLKTLERKETGVHTRKRTTISKRI